MWGTATWPLLFDALTQYTSKSGTHVEPDLATSWSSNKSHTQYTFNLRHGVKFSDGAALRAANIVASIKRALDPTTGFDQRSQFSMVASVSAPNAYKVVVTLKSPSATIPERMASIEIAQLTPSLLNTIKKDPIGSGPYKVANFTPGVSLTLVRNSQYWGPKPRYATISLVTASSPSAAVTSLNSGDLQGIGNVGLDDVPALRGIGASILISTYTSGAMVMEMDITSKPWNNPKAVLALKYAIDRPAMLKAALGNVGSVDPQNLPVPPANVFSGARKFPLDLSKAKQLFREGGVKQGATITFWTVASQPFYSTEAEILQADLAKIGIKLVIKAVPVTTWVARLYPPPKKNPWLITSNWYVGGGLPLQFDRSSRRRSAIATGTARSTSRFSPRADSAPTADERLAAMAQAQKLFQNDAPEIVIAHTGLPIAVKGIKGVWVDPRDIPHLEGAVSS